MKVLITGVTGTLGKELLKLACADPRVTQVIGLSRDEQKQRALPQHEKFQCLLGDVRSAGSLIRIFSKYRFHHVYHCAALKCVDTLEANPLEALETNLRGTVNIVECSEMVNARLVFTSTDKACYPVNIYGVSKAAAERIVLNANQRVCRYGNVLGSRGSVIQTFYRSLKQEKKIYFTHPEMTRFWIPIEEVAKFVYLSVDQLPGLYIPEMKAAPVTALAGAIARLAGVASYSAEITGIRPGEKIHECLKTKEEGEALFSNTAPKYSTDELQKIINPVIWDLRCQF